MRALEQGEAEARGARTGRVVHVDFSLPLRATDRLRILSGVSLLCQHAPIYESNAVEFLENRIVPSLSSGQFRYYTDRQGAPLAFCSWVWLDAKTLDEVLTTGRDLRAEEFLCGELPLFYDLLAPFGDCRAVTRDVKGLACFRGQRVPSIRGEIFTPGPFRPRVKYFQC